MKILAQDVRGVIVPNSEWLTLRLKNVGDDSLHNLDIKMHSTDTLQISFHSSSGYIHRLTPDEEQHLNFRVDVHGTTALYISIRYFKEGGSYHWDSPFEVQSKMVKEIASSVKQLQRQIIQIQKTVQVEVSDINNTYI